MVLLPFLNSEHSEFDLTSASLSATVGNIEDGCGSSKLNQLINQFFNLWINQLINKQYIITF